MRTLTSSALAVLLTASLAHAQAPPAAPTPAYRWIDNKGVIHWAQSPHMIPEAYATRAITPDFRDATVFPAVPPYVKPAAASALALTVRDQRPLPSVHGWWTGEARRILTAAWKGRGQDGPQPTVTFSILRDGRISIPDVERSSGDLAYDLRARDLLIALRRLPPLPPDFTGMQLHATLAFANVR
jgi:hypothetical protein